MLITDIWQSIICMQNLDFFIMGGLRHNTKIHRLNAISRQRTHFSK